MKRASATEATLKGRLYSKAEAVTRYNQREPSANKIRTHTQEVDLCTTS
jgi:hypothetical protein